jgi:hypothetical protein
VTRFRQVSKEPIVTFANVLIYLALIAYVLVGKAKGKPVGTPKRLLALPVVLVVIGYGNLTHATLKPIDIVIIAIGALLSLGLGAGRGFADKVSVRDGSPFVRWGAASFALFGINIVGKLILDLLGTTAGGTASAVGKSLIFTLGLTLLGEALSLLFRTGTGGTRRAPGVFHDHQS